jgi:hypothetical protein
MIIVLRLILIITIATVTGCGNVSFEDVSNIKPYSEVVGLVLTSNEEVILHGWTEEDHTVKYPVFYSFSLPPGTANRFVKSRTNIPAGLKLEIVAVERCTDCYLDFEPRIIFRVIPQNIKTDHELPIYLKDSFAVKAWGQDNDPVKYDYSIFTFGS